jgi:hypothetical protein
MNPRNHLPGFCELFDAVTRACEEEITQDGMIRILQGAPEGLWSRRALFSDVTWSEILTFAGGAGISSIIILQAYEQAKIDVGADNPEIDALIANLREQNIYP